MHYSILAYLDKTELYCIKQVHFLNLTLLHYHNKVLHFCLLTNDKSDLIAC